MNTYVTTAIGRRGSPADPSQRGFESLPITLVHGQRAGALPGPHKDPFDRMLVAQAHEQNVPIISNERIFDGYQVQRIW